LRKEAKMGPRCDRGCGAGKVPGPNQKERLGPKKGQSGGVGLGDLSEHCAKCGKIFKPGEHGFKDLFGDRFCTLAHLAAFHNRAIIKD
jgi:hypothetical protein